MSNFLKALKLRTKNYAFWTSLIALVPILCQTTGIFELPENYANIVNSFLVFLVAAGIVNNPITTTTNGYLDDKDESTKG